MSYTAVKQAFFIIVVLPWPTRKLGGCQALVRLKPDYGLYLYKKNNAIELILSRLQREIIFMAQKRLNKVSLESIITKYSKFETSSFGYNSICAHEE